MKKTINVAIGGCSFTIDEDAYNALEAYLEGFKGALGTNGSSTDVMDELEGRIAELLKIKLAGREVVDAVMVEEVIGQIGYPNGYKASEERNGNAGGCGCGCNDGDKPARKLFRDPDGKRIAGVCSGVALYLGVDVTLIRAIFLFMAIFGCAGLCIYIVIWIVAPEAKTAVEKCELRGLPANAENIRRFTQGK